MSTILRSRFLKDVGKIWISSTKSWKIAWLRRNTTENFIFSLKYRQQKVDLNTSKKSLVFITIWHFENFIPEFHLYVQPLYTKISYLRNNTHLRKDAAFLHFPLKECSENMVFPWSGNIRKLTKIWLFLPFFSCSVISLVSLK